MRAAQRVLLDDSTPVATLGTAACVLVVGNFDGVHRGHQAVLREAVTQAHGVASLMPCVLTFDPHPASVVGAGASPLLTTLERRAELVGEIGIERVYVRRFDLAFAAWPPERFARELVAEALQARVVVVGEDFRFGAKRAGDLALLRALGAQLGFETRMPAVARDGRGPFSSTRAREAIMSGDLDEARRVLGRPHALTGVVARGDARGRTIGFPTANLESVAELLPPDGVYAVVVDRFDVRTSEFRELAFAVTNIGMRPTVSGNTRTIEAHLLDFAEDLYGERLRLHLVAHLRGEKTFGSLDELKAQIARDVDEARIRFASVWTRD
jgi:riboflavin kinase/FMN adenylyltransferase